MINCFKYLTCHAKLIKYYTWKDKGHLLECKNSSTHTKSLPACCAHKVCPDNTFLQQMSERLLCTRHCSEHWLPDKTKPSGSHRLDSSWRKQTSKPNTYLHTISARKKNESRAGWQLSRGNGGCFSLIIQNTLCSCIAAEKGQEACQRRCHFSLDGEKGDVSHADKWWRSVLCQKKGPVKALKWESWKPVNRQ